MYYLSPNEPTYKSYIEKTAPLYVAEEAMCRREGESQMYQDCPVVWAYNTCLVHRGHRDLIVHCPFYQLTTTVRCNNSKWNTDDSKLFQSCYGQTLLERITVERSFSQFCAPVILIVYITSIFHVSEYSEIMRDFKWRFTVFMLTAKSLFLSMSIVVVLINSEDAIYNFCNLFAGFPMIMENYSHVCILVIFFHSYSIIFYKSTQIRVIKSCLKHFSIFGPLILTVTNWIMDLADKDTTYFECKIDLLRSKVFYIELIRSIISFTVACVLYWDISKVIEDLHLSENETFVFRTEYDILGERKEVPIREVLRLIINLRLLLLMSGWNMVVFIIQIYARQIYPDHMAHIIPTYTYVYREIPDVVILTVLIWFNKGFRIRALAWDLWNKELDRDENTGCRDEDFITALQETTNIAIDHGYQRISSRISSRNSTQTSIRVSARNSAQTRLSGRSSQRKRSAISHIEEIGHTNSKDRNSSNSNSFKTKNSFYHLADNVI